MIALKKYESADKRVWDEFIRNSKNGTFLHLRDYMEYHADRFSDFSLLAFRNGTLYGLFPACRKGNEWSSHAGLTFGGLITNSKATAADTINVFDSLRTFLYNEGFNRIIYTPSPHIYHTVPSEEDLYALFRANASLLSRKISSVVDQSHPIRWRNIRKAGVKKASSLGLIVEESEDFTSFWKILEDNLGKRYGVRPVHSLEEILQLHKRFPNNIRLHVAFEGNEIVAGVVMYVYRQVAHCQYISANPKGKEMGALDLLFLQLMTETYRDYKYFDFGTSNEDGGHYLNESLIYQKEGFGGRAVCYDSYCINL